MSGAKAQVAVNGHDVIGERLADALGLQGDVERVGVAAVAAEYRVRVAVERSSAVFASDPAARHEMDGAGRHVSGTLDDLLGIWQGGEKHELRRYSFCGQANRTGALNREFARVGSCNTTCAAHVAASPVTTICDGPHDRSRPAFGTGWRVSCGSG